MFHISLYIYYCIDTVLLLFTKQAIKQHLIDKFSVVLNKNAFFSLKVTMVTWIKSVCVTVIPYIVFLCVYRRKKTLLTVIYWICFWLFFFTYEYELLKYKREFQDSTNDKVILSKNTIIYKKKMVLFHFSTEQLLTVYTEVFYIEMKPFKHLGLTFNILLF